MKALIKIIPILFFLFSCTKKNTYQSFSEKELDFVSYSTKQTIRLIDTNNTVRTLIQDTLERKFREFLGFYGRTHNFHESYSVRYFSITPGPSLGFSIDLSGKFYPYALGELNIFFNDYIIVAIVDSLRPAAPALTISGTTYSNVYSLKAYKFGGTPNNTDTATMYYNRQYGIIQFLFPNGKSFTRTN